MLARKGCSLLEHVGRSGVCGVVSHNVERGFV